MWLFTRGYHSEICFLGPSNWSLSLLTGVTGAIIKKTLVGYIYIYMYMSVCVGSRYIQLWFSTHSRWSIIFGLVPVDTQNCSIDSHSEYPHVSFIWWKNGVMICSPRKTKQPFIPHLDQMLRTWYTGVNNHLSIDSTNSMHDNEP